MRINEGLVFLLFTVITCISCTHQERMEDSGIIGAQGETLENVVASADAQENGEQQVVASNEKDSATKKEENVGVIPSASDEGSLTENESELISEAKTGEEAGAGLKESSEASDGWDLTAPPLMAGKVEQGGASSTFPQTDRKRLGLVASAKAAKGNLVTPLVPGSDVGTLSMKPTPSPSQTQSMPMGEDGKPPIAATEKKTETTALASAEIGSFLDRHRSFLAIITGILLLMTWYMVRPKKKTGTDH